MKTIYPKSFIIGAFVLAAAMKLALAVSLTVPEPEPSLLAAVDVQAKGLQEGIVWGDFETCYPSLYPGYGWVREVREIASNGLFRVDYSVFPLRDKHQGSPRQLSLFLYRPESPPGSGSNSASLQAAAQRAPAATTGRHAVRLTEAELAVGAMESALVGARFFAANNPHYLFVGDSQSLSLVSHLPEAFPGTGTFGGARLRRVSFYLHTGRPNDSNLIVEHAPLLMDSSRVAPFRATLAEGASLLRLQYWDAQTDHWSEDWTSTNSLPRLVRVTLGLGKLHSRSALPQELVSRIIALPGRTVTADIQGFRFPVFTNFPPSLTNRLPVSPRNPTGRLNTAPVPDTAALLQVAGLPLAEPGTGQFKQTPAKRPSQVGRSHDAQLQWLGRSGAEYAAYILGQGSVGIAGSYDALNQKWAGGIGDTNSAAAKLPMDNVPLGNGAFSLKIIDWDRRFNINMAVHDPSILQKALWEVSGPGGPDTSAIVDSIIDWCDPDTIPRTEGVEGDFYLSLNPPYQAKDGMIEDITELLLIRGVTPAMFWGSSCSSDLTASASAGPATQSYLMELPHLPGLVDLFTPLSGRLVNINTASAEVLQVLPQIDETLAQAVCLARAGPDGVEGNEDDMPFRSPQEIAYRVPGFSPIIAQQLARYFTVRSLIFEVHVDVKLDEEQRQFVALLRRYNPRDVQLLYFYAE